MFVLFHILYLIEQTAKMLTRSHGRAPNVMLNGKGKEKEEEKGKKIEISKNCMTQALTEIKDEIRELRETYPAFYRHKSG